MSTELIGQTFGSYKLMERIGRGGMATVFRGYQEAIDRSVAVKILPAELLHDPNFLTRFLNEARTLAKLNHPAILPLYDFGQANNMPYIIMPLMTGGTLAERLQKGALPLNDVVRILTPVAQALDFAHQQSVLHRDVKPNNVLFDQHDNPYLADFGIAKAMESATNLTGTGIIGTPDYMSPEQARGDVMDGRSDIYSLGVVAYQMITGHSVFRATTPMGVIFKHASEPPRPLRQLRSDVPEGVERVVLKALEKDPALRYQSGAEFARALSEAVSASSQPPAVAPTARAEAAPTELPSVQMPAPLTPPPIAAPSGASEWGAPAAPDIAAPPKRGGMTGWLIGGGIGLVAICGLIGCAVLFGGFLLSGGEATPTSIVQVEPTNTPAPTATRRPTSTPAPQPTATKRVVNTPSVQTGSGEGFFDAFDSNANEWPTGDYDGDFSFGDRAVEDGLYRWQVTAKDDFFASVWGREETFADFRLSADMQQVSGPSDATYGFIFRRLDSDNYYNFAIADTGDFALFRRAPDGWVTIVDWTQHDAIEPGGVNYVTVEAEGAHFAFYVNDELVGEADDEDGILEAGLVGLAVSANQDQEAIFEFDDFEVEPLTAGTAFIADDFESAANPNEWPLDTFDDVRVVAVPAIRDGVLRLDVTAKDGVVYRTNPRMDEVDDFILSVDILQVSGAQDANFGVIFREQNDEYYYAPLDNDGRLRFLRWSDGEWTTIFDWTDAPAFLPNQVNTLQVLATGSDFIFLLNDEFVAEASDDVLDEGVAGIAIELSNAGDKAVFEFDNFTVLAP